jgi:hypothetical protein
MTMPNARQKKRLEENLGRLAFDSRHGHITPEQHDAKHDKLIADEAAARKQEDASTACHIHIDHEGTCDEPWFWHTYTPDGQGIDAGFAKTRKEGIAKAQAAVHEWWERSQR